MSSKLSSNTTLLRETIRRLARHLTGRRSSTKKSSSSSSSSTSELNKRFTLDYLNTVGKLFTKLGMETYDEVCALTLVEYAQLLRASPSPLGQRRLIQLTLVNISVLDLISKAAATATGQQQHRTHQLDAALQLAIDMFLLTAKRYTRRQRHRQRQCDTDGGGGDGVDLLPSIKLFVDWMLCSGQAMWHPLPNQLPPDLLQATARSMAARSETTTPTSDTESRWQIVCDLVNTVSGEVVPIDERLMRVGRGGADERIAPDEDVDVLGFLPLIALPNYSYDRPPRPSPEAEAAATATATMSSSNRRSEIADDVDVDDDDEDALDALVKKVKRMKRILLFGDYLCGLEQPILKYDVLHARYQVASASQPAVHDKQAQISAASPLPTPEELEQQPAEEAAAVNVGGEEEQEEEEEEEEEEEDEMSELRTKRNALKARIVEREERAGVFEMAAAASRPIELEIRPRFVVPDTNCFIDHQALVERVLATGYFIVVVPLLVINELDKLAKSVANCADDSIEHAEYVQASAARAIAFLHERFERRERNLKAMTSHGSLLETIQFRSEELKSKV